MSKVCVIHLLLVSSLFAQWKWPVEEVQLRKNFTPFQPYLIIAAEQNTPVFPITEGTIFLRQYHPTLLSNLHLSENFLVIRHDDELLSIYGNLDFVDGEIRGDSPVGMMRDTLMLAIIDLEKKVWVNPEILLPSLSPTAKLDTGRWYQGVKETIRPMGNRLVGNPALFVGASSMDGGLAPYQYHIHINDTASLTYRFDTVKLEMYREQDERLWFSLPLLSLREGANSIRITAFSIHGQELQQEMLVYYLEQ